MTQTDTQNGESEMYRTTGPRIGRRNFMRATAAGAGAVAVGASTQTRYSPIQSAQALPPAVVAGGWMTGVVVADWTLREVSEWLDDDDPDEELSFDAAMEIYDGVFAERASSWHSSIVDNQNILEGLDNVAFHVAKLAAFEELEDGSPTESEVQDAAIDAMEEHLATVQENLVTSWNELHYRLQGALDVLIEEDVESNDEWLGAHREFASGVQPTQTKDPVQVSLVNGDTVDSYEMRDPIDAPPDREDTYAFIFSKDGSNYDYEIEDEEEWDDWQAMSTREQQNHAAPRYINVFRYQEVWQDIEQMHSDLNDDIITWVSGVYGEIQEDELDVGDLLTPSDLAELLPEDEDGSRGLADLVALNIPVDLDHNYHIILEGERADLNLYGILAITDEIDVEAGDEIDPAEEDESYFLTHDVSQMHGEWEHFEESVDGGTVTFTEEPLDGVLYQLETGHEETVQFEAKHMIHDDEEGEWTVDISEDVDNAITTVEEVNFYSLEDETRYINSNLTDPFTIEEITDEDGEAITDPVSYSEPTEAHTDENYMTQEEFEQQQEDWDELIERIEEETSDGSGGLFPGIGDLGGGVVAVVAVILGAIFLLGD